jgi:hypothetical protein
MEETGEGSKGREEGGEGKKEGGREEGSKPETRQSQDEISFYFCLIPC